MRQLYRVSDRKGRGGHRGEFGVFCVFCNEIVGVSVPNFRHMIRHKDSIAIVILIILWLIFFWRLFTPIAEDQASLKNGDFSGQFVAFGAYQYERMSQGEIPLWNPYNNAGLPFIADTQATVFYPPRWITMGLSSLAGEWSYNALQLEMTFHVLLYTLLMYGFMRRLTLGHEQSHFASFIASVIIGYGGYTTSYPPLQLAVLEAAIWFPLSALGILEATRTESLKWRWVLLASFGLGLSWLAGHPQTSWFMTYMLVAYLGYRCYQQKIDWRNFIVGLVAFGVVTFGVTAVTFLPGIEYLLQTSRDGLGFDAKGNGFPFKDIAQFVLPGSVSLWSPLYIGIPALFFVGVALLRNESESRFWMVVALVGLVHSMGANSSFYYATYNLIPGLRFFRGQERAAFVVANSLAILAGLGIVSVSSWANQVHKQTALKMWRWLVGLLVLIAIAVFVGWMGDESRFGQFLNMTAFSALIGIISLFVLRNFLNQPKRPLFIILLGTLIIFELFTVNIDSEGTYDPVPYTKQLSISPPPLVEAVLQNDSKQPFRVDGFRGLQDNFGSLYGLMDMRGISPLFLEGPQRVIYRNYVDNPLAWELYAVKYVYSESEVLSVPSTIIAEGNDRDGHVFLHQLENPRPFAHLVNDIAIVDSDEFANALMDDPDFDKRNSIILHQEPTLELSNSDASGIATITTFEPEQIIIQIETSDNAILSLSHPDYAGWQAQLDGEPVDIIRAYGGLSAVEIPAGEYTLMLNFDPLSYRIGLILSIITWIGLGLIGASALLRR